MNMPSQDVFFILGSVRSGTTLLRNTLKFHPRLYCPEETHIFRWAEPFNSTDYNHVNIHSEVLQNHRKMDGLDEEKFAEILTQSKDKSQFLSNYFKSFKQAQNLKECRVFEKTPQNVYGLPLIKAYFPEAKIIHIVRNPLNVVASLKKGNELTPQNLIGAINFWKEAVLIINTMKPILTDNLYELKYENLTSQAEHEVHQLLDFLGEEKIDMSEALEKINPAKDSYIDVLDKEEIQVVKEQLSELMQHYGYR